MILEKIHDKIAPIDYEALESRKPTENLKKHSRNLNNS